MPVVVECLECGKRYRFEDDRRGDWVPCRECGADIEIPSRPRRQPTRRHPPRREHQRQDWEEDDRGYGHRGRGSKTGIIVGAVLGGIALLGVVVAIVMNTGDGDDVANNQNIQNPNLGQNANPTQQQSIVGPTNQNSNTSTTTTNQPKNNNVASNSVAQGQSKPGVIYEPRGAAKLVLAGQDKRQALARAIESGWSTIRTDRNGKQTIEEAQKPASWNVSSAHPLVQPKLTSQPVAIDFPSYTECNLIAADNLYFIGHRRKYETSIWDLSGPKLVKRFGKETPFGSHVTISPSGTILAGLEKSGVVVIVPLNGNPVRVELDEARRVIGFLSDKRILIANNKHAIALDTATGENTGQFALKNGFTRPIAISLDRRHIAMIGRETANFSLEIFEAESLQPVGEVKVGRFLSIDDLAFSPDGSQIAARSRNEILNWDLKTGRLTHRHELNSSSIKTFRQSGIAFASENRGWILDDRVFVERDSAKTLDLTPQLTDRSSEKLLFQLDSGRVLSGVSNRQAQQIQFKTLDIAIPAAIVNSDEPTAEPLVFDITINDADISQAKEVVHRPGNATGAYQPAQASADPDLKPGIVMADVTPRFLSIYGDFAVTHRDGPLIREYTIANMTSGATQKLRCPKELQLVDINPSGNRGLLMKTSRPDAMHLWDLQNEKHLTSWWYRTEKQEPVPGNKPRFINDSNVVSFVRGRVAKAAFSISNWETDTGKLNWQINRCYLSAFSADNQVLALGSFEDNRILLVSSVSGELLQSIPVANGVADISGPGTFHASGKKFSMLSRNTLATWDIAGGTLDSHFATVNTAFDRLMSIDEFVFAKGWSTSTWTVLSPEKRCMLWQFSRSDRMATLSPNAGYYYFQQNADNKYELASDKVDLDEIRDQVNANLAEPAARVTEPGRTTVSVHCPGVNGGSVGVADLNQRCRKMLEDSVKNAGFVLVQSGGDLTLTAELKQTDAKQVTEEYRISGIGIRSRGSRTEKITYTKRSYMMTVEMKRGEEVLDRRQSGATNSLPFSATTRDDSNFVATVKAKGEEKLKRAIESFLTSPKPLPTNRYEQPKIGARPGLGFTQMNPTLYEVRKTTPVKLPTTPTGTNPLAQTTVKPVENESSLIDSIRKMTADNYASVLKEDTATLNQRLKFSPLLKRPLISIRFGFGVQLSSKPDESMIQIGAITDKYMQPLVKPTANTGPLLINGLKESANASTFGQWPIIPDRKTIEPVLLGSGTLPQLVVAARDAQVDALITLYFYRRNKEVSMVYRIVDPYTNERLFESEKLTDEDLKKADGVDAAKKFVDELLARVKEQLKPKEIPKLTRSNIRSRLEFLLEQSSFNPVADCAEVKLYQSMQLVTEDQARKLVANILKDETHAEAIATGSREERASALEALQKEIGGDD